jgi:hypothetical protein
MKPASSKYALELAGLVCFPAIPNNITALEIPSIPPIAKHLLETVSKNHF